MINCNTGGSKFNAEIETICEFSTSNILIHLKMLSYIAPDLFKNTQQKHEITKCGMWEFLDICEALWCLTENLIHPTCFVRIQNTIFKSNRMKFSHKYTIETFHVKNNR